MSDAGLNRAERDELERLRAQVAGGGRARRGARWSGAVLLLALAAVVLVLAAMTVFARNQVLNTDRFVDTMEPLYADAEIRAAVAFRVNAAIQETLDVEGLVDEAIAAVQTRGAPDVLGRLSGPLASGINSFIDKQVTTVVHSEQFTELWREATRTAHVALVGLLTGQSGGALQLQGQDLVLDLGPVLLQVKDRLVDSGFALAERIPAMSVSFTVAQSEAFPKLRTAASLLDAASWVLPFAGLALLAAGIALAPDRRRGLLVGALCLAAGMLLLSAALVIGRGAYLAGLGDSVQSQQAAVNVYDTITRFLKGAAQTVTVLALIVALACWLLGPGAAARGSRRLGASARNGAARGLAAAGFTFGAAGGLVHRHRRAVEALLVVGGLLWIVLWRHPGVSGVVTIALVVAVLAAVVELIGRTALESERTGARPA
ncbi:hypothetical protein [Glycomyces harbinensis]|uniref:Integral membrane protein n=1 Tax=Glycomyces harbinensis TaxID=58114 RepID=A0A1G7BDX1_9ACTN|nr:hypothetical protein [Glycomyces harbinensis]SDE25221.1 hypothetical protein SAMN05216270_116101 [Glycomyces harbinensis]